jgi:hypothetical protein
MAFGGSVFVWKHQIQFVATYCAATSDAISTDAPGRGRSQRVLGIENFKRGA